MESCNKKFPETRGCYVLTRQDGIAWTFVDISLKLVLDKTLNIFCASVPSLVLPGIRLMIDCDWTD